MRNMMRFAVLSALLSCTLLADFAAAQNADSATVERGRYVVKIGGCNDCHTAGYLAAESQIPESDWLLGDTFGWRGPWGTTYGSNLRLLLGALTEDQWLTLAKNLRARPAMPWWVLSEMNDDDLRAIYAFIRYLGPAGSPAPAYLPPDQEPPLPYAQFVLPPPEQ